MRELIPLVKNASLPEHFSNSLIKKLDEEGAFIEEHKTSFSGLHRLYSIRAHHTKELTGFNPSKFLLDNLNSIGPSEFIVVYHLFSSKENKKLVALFLDETKSRPLGVIGLGDNGCN